MTDVVEAMPRFFASGCTPLSMPRTWHPCHFCRPPPHYLFGLKYTYTQVARPTVLPIHPPCKATLSVRFEKQSDTRIVSARQPQSSTVQIEPTFHHWYFWKSEGWLVWMTSQTCLYADAAASPKPSRVKIVRCPQCWMIRRLPSSTVHQAQNHFRQRRIIKFPRQSFHGPSLCGIV
jgi:hypothetical protein